MRSKSGCRRGDLGPDEAGADHDKPPVGSDHGPESNRVGERPQVVDVGRIDTGEWTGAGPGCEHEMRPVELTPLDEDEAPLQVDVLDGRVQPEVDVAVAPGARGAKEQIDRGAGPGEKLLAQRGALVGRDMLGPDDRDGELATAGAKGFGAAGARQPGADDHNAVHAAGSLVSSS